MEKLNMEVTVVITEKATIKKAYERLSIDYRNLDREYKEQRATYNLLMDENSKLNSLNSEYRGLILNNEKKLHIIGNEIEDLQRHIERKN